LIAQKRFHKSQTRRIVQATVRQFLRAEPIREALRASDEAGRAAQQINEQRRKTDRKIRLFFGSPRIDELPFRAVSFLSEARPRFLGESY
jgi:hypothetical protein